MPPHKSHAKPKAEVVGHDTPAPKTKCVPNIQWAKNPEWMDTLIEYLGDHVAFHLKLFSDSTADVVREGCVSYRKR
jgi:hypothetical protein